MTSGGRTEVAYPGSTLRDGYSDWSGSWVSVALADAGATAALEFVLGAGASPSGEATVRRALGIRDWQRSRCGGSDQVTWSETGQVQLNGGATTLAVSVSPLGASCSCAGLCRAPALGDMPVVALPDFLGLVSGDRLFLRKEDAGANRVTAATADNTAGAWTVAALDGAAAVGPGPLRVERTGASFVRVVLEETVTVRVPGVKRGACGLQTQQVIRRTGDGRVGSDGLQLEFSSHEQASCACDGGCPPPQRRGPITLRHALGKAALVGPGVTFVSSGR